MTPAAVSTLPSAAPSWWPVYLDVLAQSGSVAQAAMAAGVTPRAVAKARERVPALAATEAPHRDMPTSNAWAARYLAALRAMGLPRKAAKQAGVTWGVVQRRLDTDPDFAELYDNAIGEWRDNLEAVAHSRALDGVPEVVVHEGRVAHAWGPVRDEEGRLVRNADGTPVQAPMFDADGFPVPVTVRKPSNTVLMGLLKAHKKELFAERTEHTGAGGAPLALTVVTGVPQPAATAAAPEWLEGIA